MPKELIKPWYYQCHALDADCPITPKEKNYGKYRIIMVGDSVARGNSQYGFFHSNMIFDVGQNLIKELGEEYASKIDVLNFATANRGILSTTECPYQKDPSWKNILGAKADVVVVNIGGNDSKDKNWKGIKQFSDDYVAFIKELLKVVDNENLYILAPTPIYPDIYGTSNCEVSAKIINDEMPKLFPKIIEEVGLDIKHNYIDAHALLWGKNGDFVKLYHEKNQAIQEIFYDRCHPNEVAHQIIADILTVKMKPRLMDVLEGKSLLYGYYEKMTKPAKAAKVENKTKTGSLVKISNKLA